MKSDSSPYFPWRNRFARLTVGATLVLIFAGGLVTSTGSSLAVPDWPLSFGMLFPPMVGGVLFEHGHRMIAGAVATLTLVLAVWTWREEPRRSIRILAALALGAVLLQALLGGITVLFLLPTAVSVAHACLAQTFFCLVVAMAVVTSRGWLEAEPGGARSPLPAIAAGTTAIVYVQLVVGAVMRHTGAGLAIPDFPLAFGGIVPDFASAAIAVHFAHRLGALAVAVGAAATFAAVRLRHADDPRLLRPATLLACLVVAQIALGATTIWTRMAVVPTTLHVANGAAVLATSLVLALRARRLASRDGVTAAVAQPSEERRASAAVDRRSASRPEAAA